MSLSLNPTLALAQDSVTRHPLIEIKDESNLDLSPYLIAGEDITIDRSITSDPHRLEFTCSHGHLFDPHNVNSELRNTFNNGRKLTVRWGEKVAGVEYWQDAGTFYVTEMQLSYERGKYVDVRVSAEDMRSLWEDNHIYTTEYYNDFPEPIIADILEKNAGLISSDIELPTFENRVLIEFQRIDTTLDEVLTEICDRFGYFLTITSDNKVSARKISDKNVIDHVYPDTDTIISLEPDDKYSDFTNRVTVHGQEKTYINGTYAEEKVGTINGMVGWWGCNKDYKVQYSKDGTRTCINPRLKVIESASNRGFKLGIFGINIGFRGDISEYISYIDPNNKYCTITVAAPDLIPDALATAGGLVGSFYVPDIVVQEGEISGETIRVGTALTAIMKINLMSILTAMANFQYEIWATPAGRSRRSVQGTADDTVLQQEMGVVVEKKFEDPLCYSVADCIFVAENELMVARLQRKRVKLQKIAHLQDEEGDTIQVKHPFTGAEMKLLVTDIKRSYKKPTSNSVVGGFFDEIEGWIVG